MTVLLSLLPLLLFVVTVLGVCSLAYFWGPDDTKSKGLTDREKSALSIAIGLGIALPWVTITYQTIPLMFVGIVITGLFVAARAGRRPILSAYLSNALTLLCWFVLQTVSNHSKSMNVASLLVTFIVTVGIASFFLALPTVILYPVWERKRKHNRKKLYAQVPQQATGVPTAAQGIPVLVPGSVSTSNLQASTSLLQETAQPPQTLTQQ